MCLAVQFYNLSSDTFLRLQSKNLSTKNHSLVSEMVHLIKIILAASATNTISKRSFLN